MEMKAEREATASERAGKERLMREKEEGLARLYKVQV